MLSRVSLFLGVLGMRFHAAWLAGMMFAQIAWFYVIVCAVLGVAVGRHGLKPKGEKLYAIIGIVLSVLNILFPVLLIILAILDV